MGLPRRTWEPEKIFGAVRAQHPTRYLKFPNTSGALRSKVLTSDITA